MFWKSVIQGVMAFSHWEIWVVVATYMILMFSTTMIGGVLVAKERPGFGMAWMMLLAPLIQILATLVALMSIASILFSLADTAWWQLPWDVLIYSTSRTAAFVGAVLLVLFLLGTIGLDRVPGVMQFTTGALAIASTASLLAGISPNLNPSDLKLWPGFLIVAGFLIIAAVLQYVMFALLVVVASMFKIDPDENEATFMLMVMPVSAAVMFLPTFMYAAFLAPQLARY